MSLTLELPPELETEIRSAAARAGVALESYALTALQERVRREVPADPPETESDLLERINTGLPPATWFRYQELTAKRRADTLPDVEYPELLCLTEEVELWNARRLETLLQLARLREVPLRSLVEEMGLAPAPHA